jgi:hypothetical protein
VLSPKEGILQWYVWAGRELHWSPSVVDEMEIGEFFDYVLLVDKQNRPEDYTPAEDIFRAFM